MKLEIGRHQEAAMQGPYIAGLSQASAQQLSMLMQYAGISGIYLAERRNVIGTTLVLDRYTCFDGAPASAVFVAKSIAEGIACCMASVGLVRLVFAVDGVADIEGLQKLWAGVSNVSNVANSQNAPGAVAPPQPKKARLPQPEHADRPEPPALRISSGGNSDGGGSGMTVEEAKPEER